MKYNHYLHIYIYTGTHIIGLDYLWYFLLSQKLYPKIMFYGFCSLEEEPKCGLCSSNPLKAKASSSAKPLAVLEVRNSLLSQVTTPRTACPQTSWDGAGTETGIDIFLSASKTFLCVIVPASSLLPPFFFICKKSGNPQGKTKQQNTSNLTKDRKYSFLSKLKLEKNVSVNRYPY